MIEQLDEHGGFTMYRARHIATRRHVTIDLLRSHVAAAFGALGFEHPFRLLNRIDHPNVVKAFDFGELEDGARYLTIEPLDGVLLSRYLRTDPPSTGLALRLALQLAIAVRCIHQAGAIHHDIKPAIAMLFPDHRALDGLQLKIVRVEAAEFRDGSVARSSHAGLRGTMAYMSPEQLRCELDLDARSDIYNFGATLYELVRGQRPFKPPSGPSGGIAAELSARLEQVPTSLRDVPGVSAELDAFVLGCLAASPAGRPPDMSHVIAALDHLIASYAP